METPQNTTLMRTSNAPELVEDKHESVGTTETNTGLGTQELNESTAGSYVVEDTGTGEDEVEAGGDCNSKLEKEEYK